MAKKARPSSTEVAVVAAPPAVQPVLAAAVEQADGSEDDSSVSSLDAPPQHAAPELPAGPPLVEISVLEYEEQLASSELASKLKSSHGKRLQAVCADELAAEAEKIFFARVVEVYGRFVVTPGACQDWLHGL